MVATTRSGILRRYSKRYFATFLVVCHLKKRRREYNIASSQIHSQIKRIIICGTFRKLADSVVVVSVKKVSCLFGLPAVFALLLACAVSSVAFADPLNGEQQKGALSTSEVQTIQLSQESLGVTASGANTSDNNQSAQIDSINSVNSSDQTSSNEQPFSTTLTPQANQASSEKTATTATPKTNLSSVQVTANNMLRNVVAGKPLKPSITLKIGNKTLVEGKDYRLKFGSSYTVPTTAGRYPVYAEALDGSAYTGSKKVGDFVLEDSPFKSGTTYQISSAANSNLFLDVSGKKPKQGANATAWSRNNGDNQRWYLDLGNDGYYVLRNVANAALRLDASGKTPRQGSNVTAWANNGGMNQKWIITKEGGAYVLRSATNTSLVLDASGKTPHQGSNISVWKWNGGENQKWYIKSMSDVYADLDKLAAQNASAIANGSYVIYAPNISSLPVVDVKNGATNNGANIQTGSSNASLNQTWEISHSGNYVLIKNKKAGKYLTVASDNSLSGANVVLGSNTNARGAKWIFIKNSNGTYAIRSALYSNIALDIYGGKANAGTNIETWTANSSNAQKYAVVATPAQAGTCNQILDSNGYYSIKSNRNNNLHLDVTGASKANNANIEIWNATKQPWQIFRFQYVNGYYRVVNAHTGKALTIANNSLVPGANVVTYAVSGNTDNQLWQVRKNTDGTCCFINKKNGFALQIGSSSHKAGTNVNSSWYSSSNANQKFKLEKLSYLMPTGIFNVRSAQNGGQALDVTKGVSSNDANVALWSNNTSLAQKWSIQTVSGKPHVYTLQAVCSGKYLFDKGPGNAVQSASGSSTNAQWKATIVGGSYVLTNVATGRALDITNGKVVSGNNVGTKPVSNAMNQRWNLVETAPLPNGTFIIRSRVDNGRVFDIAGKSANNNANLDMWQYNGGMNQKFNFTRNSDGTYTIVNCFSDKALDAAKAQSSVGTNIAQYNRNGQKNQRWRVVFNTDGSFKFVSAANSAVVMAFNGAVPQNGTNVCLVKDTGAAAQHFRLEQTAYVSPMPAHQRDMLNRAQGYSSGTGYMIMVNRGTHKVGIFKGSRGNWSYAQYFSCVTGAPGSPTITGVYRTTGGKRMVLSTDSRARWCTQISGGYFFHTILASESELGHSLSHGCVRLAVPNAQWIYNNIRGGTTVVLYN